MSKLQKRFDDYHTDFTPYGEDGDYYAISDKAANFDNILDKFQKYWADTVGEDESMPDCNVGWGTFIYCGEDNDLGEWKLDLSAKKFDAKGIVISIG